MQHHYVIIKQPSGNLRAVRKNLSTLHSVIGDGSSGRGTDLEVSGRQTRLILTFKPQQGGESGGKEEVVTPFNSRCR